MSRERKSLKKRYGDSYKNREGKSSSIFKFKQKPQYITLEDDKKYNFIIIPYIIKTKNHPLVARKPKEYQIGDPDYVMDIWVHRSVGIDQEDIVCLKENYGLPCPVCEKSYEESQKRNEKESEALKAKRKVFYNIIDADVPEKGLFVFHLSHFHCEKELIEEAKAEAPKNQDSLYFADYEDGCVIQFRAKKDFFKKSPFFKCKSFKFKDRSDYIKNGKLKDEWIDNAISFDEVMKVYTYDEIQEKLYPGVGAGDEEEKEDKGKESKGDECPHKFEFGVHLDKKDECDDCKVWDECRDEYRRRRKNEEE
jgi:hypothetical protein